MVMMMQGARGNSGEVCVPPGFRFHPTDEELLYYYLRKKLCYEAIDLDVIREVDLNKLEPWDLKEKCRIGTGPQNEWYFFSHKDKKYPTGCRTNRATAAGFWKATGRDKPIYDHHSSSSSRRIGMRKTLVFYTGRAPHGQKTDWIMHEYRLITDHIHNNNTSTPNPHLLEEDGWVVCRVFKKKNHSRCSVPAAAELSHEEEEECLGVNMKKAPPAMISSELPQMESAPPPTAPSFGLWDNASNYMHLPQLLSSESTSSSHHVAVTSSGAGFLFPAPSMMESFLRPLDHHHHNKLMMNNNNNNISGAGDWAFLGKFLASNHNQSADDDDNSNDQSKYCNLLLSQAATENNNMNMNMLQVSSSTTSAPPPPQHCFPFQHINAAFQP